jgi:hypothetical protein
MHVRKQTAPPVFRPVPAEVFNVFYAFTVARVIVRGDENIALVQKPREVVISVDIFGDAVGELNDAPDILRYPKPAEDIAFTRCGWKSKFPDALMHNIPSINSL